MSYNNIDIICHHVIRIYFIVIVINRTCRQYTWPRLTSRLRHAAQHFTLNQYLWTHTTHFTLLSIFTRLELGYLINIKLIHMLSQHSPTNFLPLTLRLEIQHDTCAAHIPTTNTSIRIRLFKIDSFNSLDIHKIFPTQCY